jgi:acyl carrier protein
MYILPKGETEQMMAQIWSDLLGIAKDKISAIAHFFELGGHSLLVAKLINEINHKLNIEISYKDIFNFPLLRDMSNKIENSIKLKSLTQTLDQSSEESVDELEW